jgi:hypothetical protein
MGQKLSEVLQRLGITPEDLDDDEAGMNLAELRKRYQENAKAYTQGQQTLAETRRQVEGWHQQWQQAYGAAQQENQQLQHRLVQLEQAASQAAQAAQARGADWRKDPLFQDIAGEFERTAGIFNQHSHGLQALARAQVEMARQYTNDRAAVMDYIQRNEAREFKKTHPEADVGAVMQTARERGLNDWEQAWLAHKGRDLPAALEAAKKEGREAAIKEAHEKFGGDNTRTEMGGGGPPGPSVPGSSPKPTYEGAWDRLGKDLQAQGIS